MFLPVPSRGGWLCHTLLLGLLAGCTLLAAGVVPAFGATLPATNIPIDGTPQVSHTPAAASLLGAPMAASAPSSEALHDARGPDLTLTLPDFSMWGGSSTVDFWKWEDWSGDHADVYVAWNDLAAPPQSSQQYQTITAGDIAYMGGEFDQRIWSSDVFHFGNYADRSPGAGMDGSRAAIMIYNIRDDAYWGSSPFYVGGYFDHVVNDKAQINAVFVDSFDWPHGTGPNGSIPYLYEGTVAHEFAHLIQHDIDPNEELFVEEGICELATQFLYGPEATGAETGEYLYYHRDSLTKWDFEPFDYGAAVLWLDYLWERRGGDVLADPVGQPAPAPRRIAGKRDPYKDSAAKFADMGDRFVWQLVHDPATGLAGIINQLPGGRVQLEQCFRDWTLANLLDGQVVEPQWNYRNLALGGPDSAGLSIQDGVAFYDGNVVGNMPPTRKNVARSTVPQAWGAFYRTFRGASPSVTMAFSGEPVVGVVPPTGSFEWFSGGGDFLERTLERRIDGVQSGDELTFSTWYDIEEGFDFGYVEASSDGQDWTLLEQLSALPAFTDNIYESTAWSGPGGLTGATGIWQQARYALGALSGTVYLRFRYATDVSVTHEGWYIDDIAVGSFVDSIGGANGWVTDAAAGWTLTDGIKQTNDWTADLYVPYLKDQKSWYDVKSVVGVPGQGTTGSAWVDTQYLKNGTIWGIVSNHPDGSLDARGRLSVWKKRR